MSVDAGLGEINPTFRADVRGQGFDAVAAPWARWHGSKCSTHDQPSQNENREDSGYEKYLQYSSCNGQGDHHDRQSTRGDKNYQSMIP